MYLLGFLVFCIVKIKNIFIYGEYRPYQIIQWHNQTESNKIIMKLKYCETSLNK